MAAPTSTVCEPLSDTTTYTYSDLDSGFTPPTSCMLHSYTSAPGGYDYYESSTTGTKTKIYISLDVYRGRDPACFPPNFPAACSYTGTFTQPLLNPYVDTPPATSETGIEVLDRTWSETHYVYSPATCPGNYAPVSTKGDSASFNKTSAICCPVGFSLVSTTICQSHCSSAILENRTMTFSSSVMNLFAPTIKVVWDSSDIYRWRVAPATSTPTALLPAPSSTATDGQGPAGLSRGARIGIAVGVSAVVTATIVLAILYWRRRTKPRKVPEEETIHKAELPGEGKKHGELTDGGGLHETEAKENPKEIAEQRAPAELESDWTGWEAPALLEVELSRDGPEQARGGCPRVGQACRDSIQQTPIDMVSRQS